MTHRVSRELSEAIAALEAGRDHDAHEAVAAAWRQRRRASLAEIATLLEQRAPSALGASLREVVTPKVASTRERLVELGTYDSPLLATFVLSNLATPPFTGPSSRPLLEALLDEIERLRDPRLVALAPTIARTWAARVTPKPSRVALTERLLAIAGSLTEAEPPSEEESSLEAKLREKLGAVASRERTSASLFSDVYESPCEDAPRLVLADHLLERGDPRGELIMLQFARRDSGSAPSERERELLKKHGKEWLGALAPVISWGKGYSRSTFERGFLAHADLIQVVDKKLELVMEVSEWATVTQMEGQWPPELLRRAPLRGLRDLSLYIDLVLELDRDRWCLAGVESLEVSLPHEDDAAEIATIPLTSFPALKVLTITKASGPTLAMIERLLKLPVERLVFLRWARRESRYTLEALSEAVVGLETTTVRELWLEPPWDNWPRPSPLVFEARDGRYQPKR